MQNPIFDYVMNVIKTLLILGHIEIRREDGSPAQHVTGWFDIEQLSRKPTWIQFIAHAMAEMVAQRARTRLRTVVLSGNSEQAGIFGAMLAAELDKNEKNKMFVDTQTARMRVSSGTQRHQVTRNLEGYMSAERIVIADVASHTLGTLQQLLRHVREDRIGTKQPEIIIACGLRLCRDGIDPSTNVLTGAIVCVGYEHIIHQFAKLTRCTQCAEKMPVSHVFDPKNGFRVFDAKKERKKKNRAAQQIKQRQQADEQYQALRAQGKNPQPPMSIAASAPKPHAVDEALIAKLAKADEAFLAIPVHERTSEMVPKGKRSNMG